MSKNKKEKTDTPKVRRRFWKPRRDLPSVEWDEELNKAKFEFIKGVFETDDPKLCATLLRKGYVEVPLGQDVPPKPPLGDLPDPEELRPAYPEIIAGELPPRPLVPDPMPVPPAAGPQVPSP